MKMILAILLVGTALAGAQTKPAAPELSPGTVAALASNKEEIAKLRKQISDETAKNSAADTLTQAKVRARTISVATGQAEHKAGHAALANRTAPMTQRIAELQLRDVQLRQDNKLPLPPKSPVNKAIKTRTP